ncbi:MAG: TPM domain-containing protein [Rhizomicrobium sp.]
MAKLDPTEHARLSQAAEAVRATTSARFELLIVPVADRYALYPVAYGAFAALIAGGLLAAIWPSLSVSTAFGIEAVVFVLFSVVLEWLPLKLMLVPRRLKHERARQFAHRAFAARILAAHERRQGMVVFASLGERYVELVTDDALDRRIGQDKWNAIVAEFTATAKSGRIADGLENAITACGWHLAQHFPK